MGKLISIALMLFLFSNFSYAKGSKVIYTLNCLGCHKNMPVSIDKYFYRYLLKYSSEREVKSALISYLQKPTKEKTVMPEAFIKRFGVKKKSNLTDEKLKRAIDYYWEEYKVFGKLK